MSNLRDLYQEVILDHNKKPRNFGEVEGANKRAHGDNPLCGDKYDATLLVDEDGIIQDVAFEGQGCAISKAAASMMTQHVKGEPVEHAETLIREFRNMLTGELDLDREHHLGHLTVFEGVSGRPERVKCAVLPWHTLHAALEGQDIISTEGDDDIVDSD